MRRWLGLLRSFGGAQLERFGGGGRAQPKRIAKDLSPSPAGPCLFPRTPHLRYCTVCLPRCNTQAQGLPYKLDTLRPGGLQAAHAASPGVTSVGPAAGTPGDVGSAAAAAAARAGPDARLVDSMWTYRSAHSLALVQLLIEHRHTVCVRLRRDMETAEDAAEAAAAAAVGGGGDGGGSGGLGAAGAESCGAASPGSGAGSPALAAEAPLPLKESDAVAWILQYGDGSVGMAHTLPGHRRRGLMRLALAEMVRRLLGGDGPEQQAAAAAQQEGVHAQEPGQAQQQHEARPAKPSGAAAGSQATVVASSDEVLTHIAGVSQVEAFA